jgi:GTP-binding protein
VLLFVVDAAGSEGREPVDDLRSLVNELSLFDPALLQKPGVVFANKCDLGTVLAAASLESIDDLALTPHGWLVELNGKAVQRLEAAAKEWNYRVFMGRLPSLP